MANAPSIESASLSTETANPLTAKTTTKIAVLAMKTATTAQVSISPTTPNSQPPTAPSAHVTVPLKAYELPKSAQHVATAVNAANLNAATTTALVDSAMTAVLSPVLHAEKVTISAVTANSSVAMTDLKDVATATAVIVTVANAVKDEADTTNAVVSTASPVKKAASLAPIAVEISANVAKTKDSHPTTFPQAGSISLWE